MKVMIFEATQILCHTGQTDGLASLTKLDQQFVPTLWSPTI
jgi:hypothetical protein